jgi:hypothetical protein
MANRSGLSSIKRAMQAYFEQAGVEARVEFGLIARDQWVRSRVVWIPGRFDGANVPRPMAAGSFGGPTQKSQTNPRELAKWERQLTLSIYAVDLSDRSEEAQNAAQEALVELAIRALWRGIDPENPSAPPPGLAGIQLGEGTLIAPPAQSVGGKELLIAATMLTPFYDEVRPTVYPGLALSGKFTSVVGAVAPPPVP